MKIRSAAIIACLSLVALGFLSAIVIKWRGFRASSTPSSFEVAVARSVRNFAIPRAESRKRNPVANDPTVLQQGRDAFLARCASCHGIDGRGGTPIGVNEYPRFPNLHSKETQRLSDGDIHYNIENGVQLTGMPAMHSQSSSESWKLVSYIRNLRSATPQEAASQEHIASSAHYAGSESARSVTLRSTSGGRRRRWQTWCAIRRRIRTPSFPISAPTTWLSSPSIRWPSFTAADGSNATLPGSEMITTPYLFSGTWERRSGSDITCRIPERTGGPLTILPKTCSGPPARHATAAIQ